MTKHISSITKSIYYANTITYTGLILRNILYGPFDLKDMKYNSMIYLGIMGITALCDHIWNKKTDERST